METNEQVPNVQNPIRLNITMGKFAPEKKGVKTMVKSREFRFNSPIIVDSNFNKPVKIQAVFESENNQGQFQAEDGKWYNVFNVLSTEPNTGVLNPITNNLTTLWFNYSSIVSNVKEIKFALFCEEILNGNTKWNYIPMSLSEQSFTWNDINN